MADVIVMGNGAATNNVQCILVVTYPVKLAYCWQHMAVTYIYIHSTCISQADFGLCFFSSLPFQFKMLPGICWYNFYCNHCVECSIVHKIKNAYCARNSSAEQFCLKQENTLFRQLAKSAEC